MNLIKLYLICLVVLVLCSPESDGLFLGFILRLMLLKSALFVGMPIAIGSYMIGQGIGFMGGSMIGGYGMLRASQRYHDAERLKWTGGGGYGSSSGYGHALPALKAHAHVAIPRKKHPLINLIKAKYPYDPHFYSGKPVAITESYYGGGGGYGSGGHSSGGYGDHSVVTHDTGYVPVSYGHGINTHGIEHYAKGFNKGVFLGAASEGFKSGFRHPHGGPYQFGHTHVHTPAHSYGNIHSDHGYGGYGYESQQPASYHPAPSKGYGPSPSIFQRVMSFPTSFFSSGKKPAVKSPYGPKPPIHYIKPEHGFQQQVSHQTAGKSPYSGYTTTVVQPETTLESYDGPGKEYTGIIAGGGGYGDINYPSANSYSTVSHGSSDSDVYSSPLSADSGVYSSPGGDYASDVSSVSVHEEPDYANVGSGIATEHVKSYEGHDLPKSEPMGVSYFSSEYDPSSQPGIASDDLVQVFGSSFPQKPNAYGGGKPLPDPIGPIEFDTYGYGSPSHNGHDPLDVQASIAFDVSSEFGTGTRRTTSVTKKSSQEDPDSKGSIRVSKVVPAPNAIIEKFLEEKLEEKAKKAQGEIEKKEARNLIRLLRKAYIQQLIDSLNVGKKPSEKDEDIPDFKPLPVIPNSTTEPPKVTSSTENPTSAEVESSEKPEASTESWKRRIEIVIEKGLSANRPKRHSDDSTTVPTSSQESEKSPEAYSEEPAPAMSKEEHTKFVENFLSDVKSFFVLVSALDQDTCLQKLVCDVHTRATQPDLTTYESNIISTFRIMDNMMSPDEDEQDSTTVYRRAARVGEIGASSEICQKTYASCGYSASQIISLGQQVETADSSNFNPMVYGDIENTATAMPRV